MTELPARRLLLVHAHPDDESITTGATMAKYVAQGDHVTLVTCTLGEEGEVIPEEYAHLAADRDDALGPHRIGELAAAMAELGVTDHRFLGGPGRYRDSGMMGAPTNDRPGCFWRADLDGAAAHLVGVVREIRPQVLITYDPNGGYGHPDHIQAHRVAMRAVALAADPAFRPDLGAAHTVDRTLWICVPRSVVAEGFERLRAAGRESPFPSIATADDVPGVVDDDEVAFAVDGTSYAERKAAAMRAHFTQISVDGPFFALSNALGQPVFSVEHFRYADGTGDPAAAGGGVPAGDVFAGLVATAAAQGQGEGGEER
jgi:N-acetyl-1-D-myo-inositol-2-amino-2-deoxy-alpha-D-glucopyranoside deacetylase